MLGGERAGDAVLSLEGAGGIFCRFGRTGRVPEADGTSGGRRGTGGSGTDRIILSGSPWTI